MPYILQDRRRAIDNGEPPITAGELNYLLTTKCEQFVADMYGKLSYDGINAVMGVLASVQGEFYRRVAAPYEDEKAAQNGEVYRLTKDPK